MGTLYTYTLRIGLTYGLIFGLVSGLLSITFERSKLRRLPKKVTIQPRKSLWHKRINFGHLKIGLITGLSYGLGYGLSTELTNQLHISQSSVLANFLAYGLVLISIILQNKILVSAYLSGRMLKKVLL